MKKVHVVGAAIIDGGRCLVAQRGPAMSLAGKWEFPGGKVESGEDPRRALEREIREELGLLIEVAERLGRGSSREGAREIVLDVYRARLIGGELDLLEHSQARWLETSELTDLDWAEADIPVVPALLDRLEA